MDFSKKQSVGVKHWFSWCQWECCRFGLCQTPHYCCHCNVSKEFISSGMKEFKWCGDTLCSSTVTGSENMFSTDSVILNERETVWKNVYTFW